MKSVAMLSERQLVGSQPNYRLEPTQAVEITPQAVAVMDKLFTRLILICPAWHKALPNDRAVQEFKAFWLEELINANVRNWKLLARGLERCKQSKTPFLPSVGQFIEWCLAEDYQALGLPDEEALYRRIQAFMRFGMEETHRFKFQSNAEYWLITGLYQRSRAGEWSEKILREQAVIELRKMAKRVKSGEVLPTPVVTLPSRVEALSEERIQRRNAILQQTLAKLRGKTA